MTEQEWMACTDPKLMLEFLQGKASDRKLRLFVVSCCYLEYRQSTVIPAFEVVAKFADNPTMLDEVRRYWLPPGESAWPERPFEWATTFVRQCPVSEEVEEEDEGYPVAMKVPPIIREVFGNPFRPSSLNPAWLMWHGGLLVSMAQKMYDSRDFSDMPVLADALEEAGCDDADILGHCRQSGEPPTVAELPNRLHHDCRGLEK
jgi:hypothetical protein